MAKKQKPDGRKGKKSSGQKEQNRKQEQQKGKK